MVDNVQVTKTKKGKTRFVIILFEFHTGRLCFIWPCVSLF